MAKKILNPKSVKGGAVGGAVGATAGAAIGNKIADIVAPVTHVAGKLDHSWRIYNNDGSVSLPNTPIHTIGQAAHDAVAHGAGAGLAALGLVAGVATGIRMANKRQAHNALNENQFGRK